MNPFEPPKADLNASNGAVATATLWNPTAAALWSLLFSPIFGSVLIGLNWKALGQPQRASRAWVWLVATAVLAVVLSVLPFRTGVFNIVVLVAWFRDLAQPQITWVKDHHGKTYTRRAWWAPLGIAFGVLCLLFLFFYLAAGVGELAARGVVPATGGVLVTSRPA